MTNSINDNYVILKCKVDAVEPSKVPAGSFIINNSGKVIKTANGAVTETSIGIDGKVQVLVMNDFKKIQKPVQTEVDPKLAEYINDKIKEATDALETKVTNNIKFDKANVDKFLGILETLEVSGNEKPKPIFPRGMDPLVTDLHFTPPHEDLNLTIRPRNFSHAVGNGKTEISDKEKEIIRIHAFLRLTTPNGINNISNGITDDKMFGMKDYISPFEDIDGFSYYVHSSVIKPVLEWFKEKFEELDLVVSLFNTSLLFNLDHIDTIIKVVETVAKTKGLFLVKILAKTQNAKLRAEPSSENKAKESKFTVKEFIKLITVIPIRVDGSVVTPSFNYNPLSKDQNGVQVRIKVEAHNFIQILIWIKNNFKKFECTLLSHTNGASITTDLLAKDLDLVISFNQLSINGLTFDSTVSLFADIEHLEPK